MKCSVVPFVIAALAACLPAQKTLAELQKQFGDDARALEQKQPTREQRGQLLARQVETLAQFVAKDAKGDDRWNGRLMLADMQLARGEDQRAIEALTGIAGEAPALVLVTAAAMAQHLGRKAERDEWVKAALAKDAPIADRMAMARLLATTLHEVKASDEMFAKALAEAGDDEQRATVRWHQADALFGREDVADDAPFEALQKLAADLPKTYWGGIAKDLVRASAMKPGDDAIAFTARTRSGATFALSEQRGKVVVLAFWSARDPDLGAMVAVLQEQLRRFPDKLTVLGVNCDRGDAEAAQAIQKHGITFPVVAEGKGFQTEVALRWFAREPLLHVIDKNGKVAARAQHVYPEDAQNQLVETIGAAVQRE